MMSFIRILTALASLGATTAAAQTNISGVADRVSNGTLASNFGGGGFSGIAEFLRGKILIVVAPIAIFFVVRSGLRLINSQEDDKLTKAKNTIAATCVGVMFAYISDRLVTAFFTPGGTWNNSSATTGANVLSTEIIGILNWITVFVAVLGALIIIVSGLKVVSSFGGEDTGAMRRTIGGVVAGILLITCIGAIKLSLGLTAGALAVLPGAASPTSIISRGVGIILILIGFTSAIALGVIVYAGILMVFNLGDEDQYTKAKSLIIRSVIGLAVMLLSGAGIVFIQNLVIRS